MHHTPLKSLVCLVVTLLLTIGPNAAAQTSQPEQKPESVEPSPTLTLTAAKDQWQFRLAGDLFSYDSDFERTISGWTDSSDRSGELYGATLGIKWPGMSEGNWLEFAYRVGSLDGNFNYSFGTSLYESDLTQFGIAIKGETSSKKNKSGVPNRRWVWSIGYAYTGWDSVETPLDFYPIYVNGIPYDHLDDTATFHLLEITGGYTWAPLAVRTGDQSFFRLGPRLEGVLGIGVSLLDSNWFDDSTQIAFNFGGRAMLFADWTIKNFTIGVEGGYQYIQYFSTIANDYFENDDYSEAFSGLIGRVEGSVRF